MRIAAAFQRATLRRHALAGRTLVGVALLVSGIVLGFAASELWHDSFAQWFHGGIEVTTSRKIKHYWDPMMNPPFISDKPGKSPMGMDLVPVYEDDSPRTESAPARGDQTAA